MWWASFEGRVVEREMVCDTGQDPPGVKPKGLREREGPDPAWRSPALCGHL